MCFEASAYAFATGSFAGVVLGVRDFPLPLSTDALDDADLDLVYKQYVLITPVSILLLPSHTQPHYCVLTFFLLDLALTRCRLVKENGLEHKRRQLCQTFDLVSSKYCKYVAIIAMFYVESIR